MNFEQSAIVGPVALKNYKINRKSEQPPNRSDESDHQTVHDMLEESFHRKREKIARIRQPRSPKRKRIRRSYSSSSRSSNRSYSSSISTTPSWDRSVIATLLPNDIKKKDITNIFTSVGKIENIQLVFCSKSHQFLNKAYIEFANMESVILVGCDFYMQT